MTDERISELRQMAAVHPKSLWLDECLDEILRLRQELDGCPYNEERTKLRKVVEAARELYGEPDVAGGNYCEPDCELCAFEKILRDLEEK